MSQFIAISKESRWMKPVGVFFLIFGLIALIPFKADYLQMWDVPFFALSVIGLALLLRAAQRIGWRLNLEDNILYYGKSHHCTLHMQVGLIRLGTNNQYHRTIVG